MIEWARRPEDETPRAEQRTVQDDFGRSWVGTITSGQLPGGEDHAEVVWVCEDAPSETKLLTRLDAPAESADEVWRALPDHELREAFRRSEPA